MDIDILEIVTWSLASVLFLIGVGLTTFGFFWLRSSIEYRRRVAGLTIVLGLVLIAMLAIGMRMRELARPFL